MKRKLSLAQRIIGAGLILLLFNYGSCNKALLVPDCIVEKIKTIKAQPKWNPPAQVDEYLFNGRKVYLFSADCCDQYAELYDENCKLLCAPSGGITGKGDGNCPDFSTQAKHIRLIWKDDR